MSRDPHVYTPLACTPVLLQSPLTPPTTPTPSLQLARLYTYTPDRPHVLRICRHAGPGSIHFEWRKQFRVDTMNERPTIRTHRFIWQASLRLLVQPLTSTTEKTRIVGVYDISQPSLLPLFFKFSIIVEGVTLECWEKQEKRRESFCKGLQQWGVREGVPPFSPPPPPRLCAPESLPRCRGSGITFIIVIIK